MCEATAGAVLELVFAVVEARCVRMPAKERVSFLKDIGTILAREEASAALGHLTRPKPPALARADRVAAREAFQGVLARLMAP